MAMTAASAAPELSISRYGLTQVYLPPGSASVDVVFVHGLNGAPDKTWTSERNKTFWPARLLPQFLEDQKARILTYGYDADVVSFTDGASRDKIHNHAESLVAALAANRHLRKAADRPIVFVAHSLGGLVVKRALIYSSEIRGNHTEHLRSIFVSTYGILFLGTPHLGSNLAKWGSLLEWICGAVLPSKVMDSEPQLVDALKKNNEILQNIDRQFIQLTSRLHIYFFHEGKKTNMKGTLQYVVDEDSASPNIQDVERAVIQQDHSHMCKFEDESAPGFDIVVVAIQRYCDNAPDKIARNWVSERTEQLAKKRAEVQDILPGSLTASPNTGLDGTSSQDITPSKVPLGLPSPENENLFHAQYEVEEVDEREDASQILPAKNTSVPPTSEAKDDANSTTTSLPSSKSSEPYFVVPPGIRPNAFFIGMDKEYRELERRLFDKRRRDGTACVLLHGQPGGGKSHMARQYFFKNKSKFSGGLFWINSKSREELRHAFWDIMQKIVLRDAPELCASMPKSDFVPIVKAWFESRHEWLIVFDGVTVEREEEATELVEFVPDSKNSSIIYVSRQKNLASKHRLLRPHPIKVGPLKEDDAKKLLFRALGKKKPTEAEQKKATELVSKVGGLPLAIDAISHRLADTHEPLAKYKLSFSSDPTLEGTYNQILDDLLRLGHTEAWNLIHILCWFGQNIPVEMVNLGLKILRADRIEVKSIEETGQPDINTTFSILMRYALIERNEPDSDRDSMSSSRDSLAEPIDMLKMHDVVQSFCCDSLNKNKLLPQWLGFAVKLFTFSYHEADIKIKRRPEPGRVSDYRYYLTHGQKLWDHTEHYGKMQPLEDLQNLMRPVINMIHEEIQLREPRSSQESLMRGSGVFQISIFDRTSSSSDSGHGAYEAVTPDQRTPLPPIGTDTSPFGFPLDKEPTDSPRSFGTASPGVRILDHTPRNRPIDLDDAGYESDREGGRKSHPMLPSLSQATARPYSRSRASTAESRAAGWQVVTPRNRPRNRRRRRDLGSFRPTPSRAQVSQTNAVVVQGRGDGPRVHRRESSPAFRALERVQSNSPPPPVQNRVASIFRPFSITSSKANDAPQQPSWAKVAAGKIGLTKTSGTTEHHQAAPLPAGPIDVERGRTSQILKSRHGNAGSATSPLTTEFVLPLEEDTTSNGGRQQQQQQQHGSPYSAAHNPQAVVDSRPTSSRKENAAPGFGSSNTAYYPQEPRFTANPNPLPIETGTTISTAPPYPEGPAENVDESTPQTAFPGTDFPTFDANPFSPSYPQTNPFAVPTGYSSQPMSRDPSHQSRTSAAETEPPQSNPYLSPYIGPSSFPALQRQYYHYHFNDYQNSLPSQQQQQQQQQQRPEPTPGSGNTFSSPPSASPRDRRADGRALKKSPRTDFAVPAIPPLPSPYQSYSQELLRQQQQSTAMYPGQSSTAILAGTRSSRASSHGSAGHYAANTTSPRPGSTPGPSPGPGIALRDPITGLPTNVIVGFHPSPQMPSIPGPAMATSFPPSPSYSPLQTGGTPVTSPPLTQPSPEQNTYMYPSRQDPGWERTSMQFGTQEPILLQEARQRTIEAEERLRLRRQNKGYPDVNLIPTGSDRATGSSFSDASGSKLEDMVQGLGMQFLEE